LKVFNERSASQILEQILLAVNYMHQRNITHRDIKPENILMESQDPTSLQIKMTDFGFASFYNPKDGLNDVLGSPLYMAPEIVDNQQYNAKVDIWSIGVIAYILLSGRPPYKGKSKQEIFNNIKNTKLSFENKVWRNVSEGAK
jgi:serine/threonine protein kinase